MYWLSIKLNFSTDAILIIHYCSYVKYVMWISEYLPSPEWWQIVWMSLKPPLTQQTLLQSIMQTNVNTNKIACTWPLIRTYGRRNTSTFLFIQSGIYNRSECDLDLKRKYMYIKPAPYSWLKMNTKYMSFINKVDDQLDATITIYWSSN